MKVLISTIPLLGHVNPFQPVALELTRRGHEVQWLTGTVFKADIEMTGATFVPFSDESTAALGPSMAPDQTIAGKGLAGAISNLIEIFVDPIQPILAQYKVISNDFQPDLVLVDLCCLPAFVWHELGGPVHATLSVHPLFTMTSEIPPWGSSALPPTTTFGRWMNSIQHWMADYFVMSKVNDALNVERAKLGLKEPLVGEKAYPRNSQSSYLHIMPTTMAFEFPRELGNHIRFVGPLLPVVRKEWSKPKWWEENLDGAKGRRVVYVTQGTMTTTATNLINPTMRALAREDDILIIVTTPDADAMASEIGVSENVKMEKFIPNQELLKHVSVMVTNGGYGGVTAALSNGVPLVGAGLTADKAMINARIAWAGVGIDLRTNTPSDEQIRCAVRTVLDDETFSRKAKSIQADFAKYNGPKNACDALEILFENSRTLCTKKG